MNAIVWRTLDDVPRDGKPVTMWHSLGMSAKTVRYDDRYDDREPWCEETFDGDKKFWPDRVFSRWTRDFEIKKL